MQEAIKDLARFGKVVKLKSFIPFTSAQLALENINSISEGMGLREIYWSVTIYSNRSIPILPSRNTEAWRARLSAHR